jgi:hypothetical protein
VVATSATALQIADAVYSKMSLTVYNSEVFIDTVGGVPGTVVGVNGTPNNPVNNWTDAKAIAVALGVKQFRFRPDSEITLNSSAQNFVFYGAALIHLGGQDISDSLFVGSELIDGVSSGNDARFDSCQVGTCSIGPALLKDCFLSGVITLLSSGDYTFLGCGQSIPSTSSDITFVANAKVGLRRHSGSVKLNSLAPTNSFSVGGDCRLVLASTCTGGTVKARGAIAIEDNVVGGFTGTIDGCIPVRI